MAPRRYLHVLVDETGVDLEFFATKKEFEAEFARWIAMGTEPSHRLVSYIPTVRGVAALVNSLKQDAD